MDLLQHVDRHEQYHFNFMHQKSRWKIEKKCIFSTWIRPQRYRQNGGSLIWSFRVYETKFKACDKQYISILIKHESCMFVCPRFPKPPKVPGSWNFCSRPNLGHLRSLWSPIFKILIFKGGSPYGPVLKIDPFSVVHPNLCHLRA